LAPAVPSGDGVPRSCRALELEHYEAFISTKLGDVPGIARLDSHLTMKTIKSLGGQLIAAARGSAASRDLRQ
jgi:hypothetical protein